MSNKMRKVKFECPEDAPFDLIALACKMLGWSVMHGGDDDDTGELTWIFIGRKDKLERLRAKLEEVA